MKAKSSIEINNKIIFLYLSGKDTYQVAKECQCSQTFVINTLKQHDIPRRTTQSYTKKYITNEKFFDIIDTEDKAYMLGFLYADGNNYVKNNNYEISIKLQAQDKLILEKFKTLISPQSNLKIIIDKKTLNSHYLLKINSKILSHQLSELGCVPNKSLILTFPELIINSELKKHFIRGYFDGDGSLYNKKPTKTGYINYGFSITSTNQFCLYIKQYLKNILNIHCSIKLSCPLKNKITTTISVGGNLQVIKLLNWLYKDSNIHMERKHKKYLELINYYFHLQNHLNLQMV